MELFPYRPVLTHPVLRRVLPGLAVSALGDGMSVVAVSWLALRLAPTGERGTWVAIAVGAYALPAAAGAVVFRRWARGRDGTTLAGWNATLRAVALGAIPVAYALGVLDFGWYVALLGASSLLAAWGGAGRYTLVAESLPERHHLAANALLTTIAEFATIVGPPLAGFLISSVGAPVVIALDAASFAVLAATYRFAVPRARPAAAAGKADGAELAQAAELVGTAEPAQAAEPVGAPSGGGFRLIRRDPQLLGLLALTFGFFFLFGPVYVALPIHVAVDLHASATVLGAYYTAFGIGSVAGALATGYLRRWRLWPTTVGIVIGFGLAMLPLGLGAPLGVALASFAVAGLVWAPYLSISMALFQRDTAPEQLATVLAANGAVTVLAVPLGTMVGGPLVTATSAGTALLCGAVGTVLLGAIAAGLIVRGRGPDVRVRRAAVRRRAADAG